MEIKIFVLRMVMNLLANIPDNPTVCSLAFDVNSSKFSFQKIILFVANHGITPDTFQAR